MKSTLLKVLNGLSCVALLLGSYGTSHATDLANEPLASTSTAAAKPNIMFTLDDSGSMGWSFIPDVVENFASKYGFKSAQCNGVYYDPNKTYDPPKNADGTSFPNSSFTSAWLNGFNQAAGTVNLSTSFKAYSSNSSNFPADYTTRYSNIDGSNDTAQAAYYYAYTGSQVASGANYANVNSNFYKECNSSIGSSPGKNVFTKVTVSSTSGVGGTDERQNFANWFSYYRTRIMTMKTGAGTAFSELDDSYRVGFNTISYTGVSDSSNLFLNIRDFSGTQKTTWFSKFYASVPSSSTPLRNSMAKVGQIYAGRLLTGADDPVQYSCQRNYLILSTDGYWNDSNKPTQVDGITAIGQQDGVSGVTRPSFDGTGATGYSATNSNLSNTLSDTAYYYYHTDLRSGTVTHTNPDGTTYPINFDNNNVPPVGSNNNTDDVASWQHMTSFAIGLGVDGTLSYQSDYKTATSGAYYNIMQGTANWPIPASNQSTTVDDLWHAAVSGRGYYYSAKSPDTLVAGLSDVFNSVKKVTGSGAAAATSSLNPVSGNNSAFVASYTTVQWVGDVAAYSIDPNTGALSASPTWTAANQLNNLVSYNSDTRNIYTYSSSTSNKLRALTWANLTSTEQQNYFTDPVTSGGAVTLSQVASWTSSQIANATGSVLLNYLRGQWGYENQSGDLNGDGADNSTDAARRLFRDRASSLGDIVHAQPVYVAAPPFNYSDPGYLTGANGQTNSGFKYANSGRQAVVYVASNDGMLHAFNATTGVELWTYVPPMVLPDLWRLADSNYATNHRYYVDGSITVGDVCVSNCTNSSAVWKTILVGALGKGGKGYYALDVTNPASPQAMWNFQYSSNPASGNEDSDVGYSYGNPIITKRASDGAWVVLVTSGYNNTDANGDGEGYLYVLNAGTGAMKSTAGKIATGVGDTGSGGGSTGPSGLAKISNWVTDFKQNNTTQYVYGGDLLGNMWRFDLYSGSVGRVGYVKTGGTYQSITDHPELMRVNNGTRVLMFGTGRYLGQSDPGDTTLESFYAIKDTGADVGNIRTDSTLVQKTPVTNNTTTPPTRTQSDSFVNWNANLGWYIDLPDVGERVTVDPVLMNGTIVFASIVPNTDACDAGGYSWLYYLDALTGNAPLTSSNDTMAQKYTGSLIVGVSMITKQDGGSVAIITKSDGSTVTQDIPTGGGASGTKRVSWRELISD